MGSAKACRPRVLVAMAHAVRRRRVVTALREDGWSAVAVADGYQLIGRLAAAIDHDDPVDRPDLVIVDIALSGCSGLTIVEGLRALGWPTPIFAIADFNRPDAARRALAFGATQVFEKPVDVELVRKAAAAVRPAVPASSRRRPGSGLVHAR